MGHVEAKQMVNTYLQKATRIIFLNHLQAVLHETRCLTQFHCAVRDLISNHLGVMREENHPKWQGIEEKPAGTFGGSFKPESKSTVEWSWASGNTLWQCLHGLWLLKTDWVRLLEETTGKDSIHWRGMQRLGPCGSGHLDTSKHALCGTLTLFYVGGWLSCELAK